MSTSAETMEEVQKLMLEIEQLPETVNPYQFVMKALHAKLTPNAPAFFVPTLYVAVGLAVVGLLLGLSSLVFKSRYSALWVVRKRHTPMGTVITTNTTTLLAILNCIHFAAAIAAEAFMIRTFTLSRSPVAWQALQPILWLPVALSGWTETAGTALASILSKTGRSSRSKSMLSRMPGKTKPSGPMKAWQINALTSSGYIAVPIACIPVFALGAAKLQLAWEDLMKLEKAIKPAAAAWQQGQAFEVDPALLPLLSSLDKHGNEAILLIGRGFIALVALLLAAAIFYIPSVTIYIRMLHRQLHSYVNNSVGSTTAAAEERHRRTRLTHLRNTYQLMIAESAIVLTLNVSFIFLYVVPIDGGTVGIFPKTIISNGRNLAIIFSICLLVYGMTGVLLNGILAYRAIQPLLVRSSSPKNFAEAIAVETVVQRFMDGDHSQENEEDDGANKVELAGRRQDVLSFSSDSLGDESEQKSPMAPTEKSDHPFTFSPIPAGYDHGRFQRGNAV